MKKCIQLLFFLLTILYSKAQTCEDVIKYVKSKSYGTSYTSYNSEAISKVTFYEIYEDYQTYYYAIVCFKRKYSYSCSEYIYQVGQQTKFNYSMNYLASAGKAFWEYIQPYWKVLGCGLDFEDE